MVKIGHASLGSNGRINGDKAGDQNGKEVYIRNWYSKPWTHVIRFKNSAMREKVADCMIAACNNNHIGYNQATRNTLLLYARNVGYNPALVNKVCDTDCSALVTLCCLYAGVQEKSLVVGGNSSTTSTLRKRLVATGTVEVFTTKDYTTQSDKLMRGDILLSEGHHVAVVIEASNKVATKPIEAVAKEVCNGLWGTGESRRKRLTDAGYDYKAVQAEVNRLSK